VLRLNATASTLLGFLHDRPMTGWELFETVELTVGAFWNVTRSQVYRELHKLEEEGLVLGGERGVREKRSYEITAAGRAAFSRWIREEPGPLVARFPLLLTTWFGDHLPPEQLEAFLRAHRLRHEQRHDFLKEVCDELEDTSTPGARVARFGLFFERMMLDWFDTLPHFGGVEPQGPIAAEPRPSQPRRPSDFEPAAPSRPSPPKR
jgi:DNA-binding PadR family transcriptional regulator